MPVPRSASSRVSIISSDERPNAFAPLPALLDTLDALDYRYHISRSASFDLGYPRLRSLRVAIPLLIHLGFSVFFALSGFHRLIAVFHSSFSSLYHFRVRERHPYCTFRPIDGGDGLL